MDKNLMQASREWSSRPDDQRFASLPALAAFTAYQKAHSRATVVSSRKLRVEPLPKDSDYKGLQIVGPGGNPATMTNWSFGQLSQLAGAPAGYLRKLPSPLTADNLNFGLQIGRDVEDVGVLLHKNGDYGEKLPVLRAATGPDYGRVWNADIADMLVKRFGDGRSGDWRVPGEFGKEVDVTKANTTIFGSDRDIFIFLADEKNRIEVPGRRASRMGTFARGFFVWNSEVGAATIGAAFFLFDYVCCNRIIWSVPEFSEVRIRHTAGAPDRWLGKIVPVLNEYSTASAKPVIETIKAAQQTKLTQDVDKFLAERFGRNKVAEIKRVHEAEEHKPIETVFDAVTAATAYAKQIPHQDLRVAFEIDAGKLLDKVMVAA